MTNMTSTAKSGTIQCPTCLGTGKIMIGYGAICMEPIAKVKKCPDCKGKGHIGQNTQKD